jgi:hypothetical protein
VFERFGGAAESAGCGLVTAFGYGWVPGNLAGALACATPATTPCAWTWAYFITGAAGASGGTRASVGERSSHPPTPGAAGAW